MLFCSTTVGDVYPTVYSYSTFLVLSMNAIQLCTYKHSDESGSEGPTCVHSAVFPLRINLGQSPSCLSASRTWFASVVQTVQIQSPRSKTVSGLSPHSSLLAVFLSPSRSLVLLTEHLRFHCLHKGCS